MGVITDNSSHSKRYFHFLTKFYWTTCCGNDGQHTHSSKHLYSLNIYHDYGSSKHFSKTSNVYINVHNKRYMHLTYTYI